MGQLVSQQSSPLVLWQALKQIGRQQQSRPSAQGPEHGRDGSGYKSDVRTMGQAQTLRQLFCLRANERPSRPSVPQGAAKSDNRDGRRDEPQATTYHP